MAQRGLKVDRNHAEHDQPVGSMQAGLFGLLASLGPWWIG